MQHEILRPDLGAITGPTNTSLSWPENPDAFIVPPGFEGQRLDYALGGIIPNLSLRARRRLCENALVLINGRPAAASLHLKAGMRIEIQPPTSSEFSCQPIPHPSVIASHQGLAAVTKAAGLPCVSLAGNSPDKPALEKALPTLFSACDPPYPRLLNRLDTGTSGIVLVGMNQSGESIWRHAENSASVRKNYLAVVEGAIPVGKNLSIDAALDTDNRKTTRVIPGAHAPIARQTMVEGLDVFQISGTACSLVVCTIILGARHQIRAHLAHIGHPLYGDIRYGAIHQAAFLLHHTRCALPGFTAVHLPDWSAVLPGKTISKLHRRFTTN